jgi:hypothetical protein
MKNKRPFCVASRIAWKNHTNIALNTGDNPSTFEFTATTPAL